MAKRPPARNANRKPATEGTFRPLPAVEDAGSGDGNRDVTDAGPTLRPAANREEFAAMVAQVQEQGHISVADEAAILREYDGLLLELKAEKQRLEADYRTRVARDGQVEADAWLRDEAGSLGRRQGEQLQRLVKTIPALASQAVGPTGSAAGNAS